MKIQHAVEEFLATRYNIKDTSKALYKKSLDRFSDFIEKNDICKLTRNDVARYVAHLKEHHNDGGVSGHLRILNIFVKFCKEEHYCELGTSAVPSLKVAAPPKEILDEVEYEFILDECPTRRDELIIRILWETGIRVAELCNIMKSDINGNVIQILRGKSYKRSMVYLSPATTRLLNTYLTEHDHDTLFATKKGAGITPRAVQRMVKNATYMLDKDVTPHTFRHTLAWRILDNGGEMIDVKNALGHTAIETTANNYMNWHEDLKRQRIQKSLNYWYDGENAEKETARTGEESRQVIYGGQVC